MNYDYESEQKIRELENEIEEISSCTYFARHPEHAGSGSSLLRHVRSDENPDPHGKAHAICFGRQSRPTSF